ncbi:MAG TPA: peroxidase-related enzyme [Candidatus Polarisedimenticolia bacterium]|nr:peroxidase-related enzyme [Candidatus Polarisedimenticolia bacterium]
MADSFAPFAHFRQSFGFVPSLFRAQSLLPRVIEAETRIAAAVLEAESVLTRMQKECILLKVACSHRNIYCATAHARMLESLGMRPEQVQRIVSDHRAAELAGTDVALLDFALKLSRHPTLIGRSDIEVLREHGFSDEGILEGVLMTALTNFLCTLAVGLGVEPDSEPRLDLAPVPSAAGRNGTTTDGVSFPSPSHGPSGHGGEGRYLRAVDLGPAEFPPFAFFKERFGFIPNVFRAQTLRPDVVEAEAAVLNTVLLSNDILSRVRKEYILLVVSAANLNTYFVAVHCEMLRALGVSADMSDQVAIDHHQAGLSPADVALLDFALKLAGHPADIRPSDIEGLRAHGFADEQILESIAMTGLSQFLNTLQMGLGTTPDFEPRRVFPGETSRPQGTTPVETALDDPDAPLVVRAQAGDMDAFEELVRAHHRRVYRTLLGITANAEDAEDSAQNAFIKAFDHISEFKGTSRFSTWLTRIAINEGLQRMRRRRPEESLDGQEGEEEFRPRHVLAWSDDPERVYSRAQLKALVEKEIMKLPAIYRAVVVLRDIEELSTEEAASSLGIQPATLKTRLHRGRLMLREALAPHFARPAGLAGGGEGV